MENGTPKKTRFIQGVDLLNKKNEAKTLRRARKVTGKRRGFSQYVRQLIEDDFNKAGVQ